MYSFSIELLLQMVSVGLVFILIATGVWRKSFSTTVYVVALAIALQCYLCNNSGLALLFIVIGAVLTLLRAMFHHTDDCLIRD